MKKQIQKSVIAIVVFCLLAAGCSNQQISQTQTPDVQENNTGFIPAGPGSYDSADTAVITKIDEYEDTITFLNMTVGKRYTLSYDGTTVITDKYGQGLSMAQMREGDVVDVTFLRSKKKLSSMRQSADSFIHAEVSRYDINTIRNDMTVGADSYKITDDTVIFSEGREISLMDINSSDVLTVKGIGTSIYSIVVEKGHGYLQLSNDEKFIGGFIEVGQSRITQITEDMLLVVPEGSYQVLISHRGGGGTKQVIINRNEEVTLDIGDLTIPEPKYGTVVFNIIPENATLYIDGTEEYASGEISLEYGIHQYIVRASGYGTATGYVKVNRELTPIDIVLEPLEDTSNNNDNSSNNNNSDKDDVSGNENKTYQVHIDAPEGAEVYLDGNYIGIAPVSFDKTVGSHVITLRKTGYETRSYTITLNNEEKDVNYVFAELEVPGTLGDTTGIIK